MVRSRVLGIDAGSATTVAVLADTSGDVPEVIGVGMVPSTGMRKGVVVDLEATSAAIAKAAAQAFEMADHTGPVKTVLSVSGHHVQSTVGSAEVTVHRPSLGVSPEDVRRVLDAAAVIELTPEREVMHVVPRAFRLDGTARVSDPIGLAGRVLAAESLLITGESLPIQNALKSGIRAGLEVADFQLALRASSQAVITPQEAQAGVLLIEIGAGTTGVAVLDNGHLWHVGVIPVGGDHITNDLATLLRMPVAVAEEIKRTRGWASVERCPKGSFELPSPSGQRVRQISDQDVAEIIASRVHEILGLAAGEVKRSGYDGLFPGGLVLTGGGSRLQGLVETAADLLGLPTRIGQPQIGLADGPEFSAAYGLVLWGARLSHEEAVAVAVDKQSDRWGGIANWLGSLFRTPNKEDM